MIKKEPLDENENLDDDIDNEDKFLEV